MQSLTLAQRLSSTQVLFVTLLTCALLLPIAHNLMTEMKIDSHSNNNLCIFVMYAVKQSVFSLKYSYIHVRSSSNQDLPYEVC